MLVFGAIQFKSSNDGGLEIIVDGTHQFITNEEVQELQHWINFRPMKLIAEPSPLRYRPMDAVAAQDANY